MKLITHLQNPTILYKEGFLSGYLEGFKTGSTAVYIKDPEGLAEEIFAKCMSEHQ